MSNFIHFGCWNNLNKGCLKKVMNLLSERLTTKDGAPKIDFLTIAGDNYYPEKVKKVKGEKKKKIINTTLLAEGFSYLPKEIPIYMVLGNHDLETNTGEDNFFIDNLETSVPINTCPVIYQQIAQTNNTNIEYSFFKEMMIENRTQIIMIDTSIYSADAREYIPCYNVILPRNYVDVDEIRQYQHGLIMTTIMNAKAKGITNLILIGHHPIIGLKKKDEADANINDIIMFDNVLKGIYYELKDNDVNVNYFYLCADVHLYQEGNIGVKLEDGTIMNIQQYIVGTGGTELDKCVVPPSVYEDDRLTYNITRCVENGGFLECINTPDNLTFRFNEIPKEGGRRKSRKSRRTRKNRKTRKHRKSANYSNKYLY